MCTCRTQSGRVTLSGWRTSCRFCIQPTLSAMGAFAFVDRDALILLTPRAPKTVDMGAVKRRSNPPARHYCIWQGNRPVGGYMRTILWVIVAAFPFVATAQAADLEGTWVYDTTHRAIQPWKGDPDSVVIRIVFKKEHGVLTGTYIGTMGNFPLSNLTVHDNRVSYETHYFADETVRSHGKLSGNNLLMQEGTEEALYRRATPGDLKRIAASPVYSFKKLPLPALHDVPTNGLALTPPMGLGNWTEANDKTVRQTADLLVANGMRDAGYVYIQIDEGWQGRRDTQGNLRPNGRFPDMKALADYLHARGFKLGVYSSPGPMACYGYAGSHGHEEQDAKTFAAWGVDYLKYDWCSADTLYHTESEMRAAYQKMGAALEASGRPILFGLCQ